jgi:hypothetical protein
MRLNSLADAKPPGWIWLRNSERPMPELVEKNVVAVVRDQVLPEKALEAPKPSIL